MKDNIESEEGNKKRCVEFYSMVGMFMIISGLFIWIIIDLYNGFLNRIYNYNPNTLIMGICTLLVMLGFMIYSILFLFRNKNWLIGRGTPNRRCWETIKTIQTLSFPFIFTYCILTGFIIFIILYGGMNTTMRIGIGLIGGYLMGGWIIYINKLRKNKNKILFENYSTIIVRDMLKEMDIFEDWLLEDTDDNITMLNALISSWRGSNCASSDEKGIEGIIKQAIKVRMLMGLDKFDVRRYEK